MKKISTALAFVALLALSACGGKSNDNTAALNAVDSAVAAVEESLQAEPADTTAKPERLSPDSPIAIVDGYIVPVDDFGTVVDLYADWCPPCKKLKPIFAQLKAKYEGKLNFVSINTDDYKNVAEAYNVSSIPTLLFISADGKELGRMVGFNPAEEIESQLASFFPEELK